MIVGIGLDACSIDRMRRALDRHGDRFFARICSEAERADLAGEVAGDLARRAIRREGGLREGAGRCARGRLARGGGPTGRNRSPLARAEGQRAGARLAARSLALARVDHARRGDRGGGGRAEGGPRIPVLLGNNARVDRTRHRRAARSGPRADGERRARGRRRARPLLAPPPAFSGAAVGRCGPGNNGGDGFVVARHLVTGAPSSWCSSRERFAVAGDARASSRRCAGWASSSRARADLDSRRAALTSATFVVDAVYGTGLSRRSRGRRR